jgi:tryptophan-rich sensory protein
MQSLESSFQRVYGSPKDTLPQDSIFKILCGLMLILPLSIFFSKLYRDMSEDAKLVKSKPTNTAYGWAWSIIVVLLCFSSIPFIRAANSRLEMIVAFVHIVLIVVLGWMWVVYYEKDKQKGISLFVFLTMVALATVLYYYSKSPESAVMVSPLLVWTVIQYMISSKELDIQPTNMFI